jgi:hypothetical protein
MDTKNIKKVAIYPAIGIARIGNSPEYFLASDLPGVAPVAEDGFKDGDNLFKKQVPLFRIYALDENDNPLYEINMDTAADVNIEWNVHVANRKAAWYQFNNALDLGEYSIPSLKRNGGITGVERDQLVIDPGPRTISGKDMSGKEYQLDTGKFFDKEVSLGELKTDDKGRLLFFGGDGNSESRLNIRAITFANNDDWHDDTSDGVVRAKVTIGGQTFDAKPAVVACTPPNFGQGLFPVVSMLDVVQDLYLKEGWIAPKGTVNFYEDIYPILSRMSTTQWVNEGFFVLFGTDSPSDFNNPEFVSQLENPGTQFESERKRVFEWFRDHQSNEYEPTKLPPHYGDLFGDYEDLPAVDLSVTATQYEMLRLWSEGNFVTGKPKEIVPFEELSASEQVDALLKAPLEECLGGPFHPGIEITWPFRHLMMWDEPFRLKVLSENEKVRDDYGGIITSEIALSENGPLDGTGPGSLTRWLGVPWQTDEASCMSGYDVTLYLPLPSFWSVRVPNTILSMDSYDRLKSTTTNEGQKLKHFSYRVDWMRDFTSNYVPRINNMVAKWYQLGIITKQELDTQSQFLPDTLWVETDREGPVGIDPTLEQVKHAEREATISARLLKAAPRESHPLKRHEL